MSCLSQQPLPRTSPCATTRRGALGTAKTPLVAALTARELLYMWQLEASPNTSNLPSFAEMLVAHGKLAETVEEMQTIIDMGNRDQALPDRDRSRWYQSLQQTRVRLDRQAEDHRRGCSERA